jgi:hypothetical protein
MSGSRNDLARLYHLESAALPARGVGGKQPILDRVIEDLREQVEHHVHAARREAGRLDLAAEGVDAVRVELVGRVVRQVAKHTVQAPPVVEACVGCELGLAAPPPAGRRHVHRLLGVDSAARVSIPAWRLPRSALDLLEDAVELDACTLDAPALVAGAEVDAVAPAVRPHPRADRHCAPITPGVRLDRATCPRAASRYRPARVIAAAGVGGCGGRGVDVLRRRHGLFRLSCR